MHLVHIIVYYVETTGKKVILDFILGNRICTDVTITNPHNKKLKIYCEALVDSGSTDLILPLAWKHELGKLDFATKKLFLMASAVKTTGEIYGPVNIKIKGFRTIKDTITFMDMKPDSLLKKHYCPILGYSALAKSKVWLDIAGKHIVRFENIIGN